MWDHAQKCSSVYFVVKSHKSHAQSVLVSLSLCEYATAMKTTNNISRVTSESAIHIVTYCGRAAVARVYSQLKNNEYK